MVDFRRLRILPPVEFEEVYFRSQRAAAMVAGVNQNRLRKISGRFRDSISKKGKPMRIAYVGCGYVADFYQETLTNYRDKLELAGVFDRNAERKAAFAAYYSVPTYDSLEELLADGSIDIVLNLTNPQSHYPVSMACLAARKHVYSEKPLAMTFEEAKNLYDEGTRCGVRLASAPCNVLGEAAQTMWKDLRDGRIGQVYLAYAALDGGLKHRQHYRTWVSRSGANWPAINEFETGCTLEHAGYVLTWLVAFFGPARLVTSFSACLVADKSTDQPLEHNAPDFSVGCIEFKSGVVARVTNSIVARRDHSLLIFGEKGTLMTADVWDSASPVYEERIEKPPDPRRGPFARWRRRAERLLKPVNRPSGAFGVLRPPVRVAEFERPQRGHPMDFMRGVAELAEAITDDRPCRLSPELALHITEITLTLQRPEMMGVPRLIESTLSPIEPMPWGF